MDRKSLIKVLKFASIVLLAIATLLFFAPFVSLQFGDFIKDISWFKLFTSDIMIDSMVESEFIQLSIVRYLVFYFSFAGTVSCLAVSCLGNLGLKKLKPEHERKAKVRGAILYAIFASIAFIGDLSMVSVCGYGKSSIAHLGWGAITSALSLFAGVICFEIFNYLELSELKVEKRDLSSEENGISSQLKELASLKEQGLISEEDYENKKKQILNL